MHWDARFEEVLRQYLPFLPDDTALTADISLRDYGLDSMGIVDLLSSMESEYGIQFVDDALVAENFETPAALWRTLSEMFEPA